MSALTTSPSSLDEVVIEAEMARSAERETVEEQIALGGSLRDYQNISHPNLLTRAEQFYAWQDTRRRSGVWPYSRSLDTAPRTIASVKDDRGIAAAGINFASQDYLSLASHPAIEEAAVSAIRTFGVHSAGSPALIGNTSLSLALERALSDVLALEHTVLYPTGWAAGYGVCKGLVRPTDYVVLDALTHACLQEGACAATPNVRRYHHLNLDHARRIVRSIREKDANAGILVVSEGIFSMDSDAPDIPGFQAMCHEYDATLLIDVAHDFGCLGPNGTGQIGIQDMLGKVDVVMGSFSKTFAANGGFVATRSRAVKEYLKYYSPSQTFSNALSPVQIAVITQALRIVQSAEGEQLRQQLDRATRHLRTELANRGVTAMGLPSAIVPVLVGSENVGRVAARLLPEYGLLANLVEYPAVAANKSRFRLQVMAAHQAEQTRYAADAVALAISTAHRILGLE